MRLKPQFRCICAGHKASKPVGLRADQKSPFGNFRTSVGDLSRCSASTEWCALLGRFIAAVGLIVVYWPNRPLFGSALCPLLGRKGASARLASFSRRLGG